MQSWSIRQASICELSQMPHLSENRNFELRILLHNRTLVKVLNSSPEEPPHPPHPYSDRPRGTGSSIGSAAPINTPIVLPIHSLATVLLNSVLVDSQSCISTHQGPGEYDLVQSMMTTSPIGSQLRPIRQIILTLTKMLHPLAIPPSRLNSRNRT